MQCECRWINRMSFRIPLRAHHRNEHVANRKMSPLFQWIVSMCVYIGDAWRLGCPVDFIYQRHFSRNISNGIRIQQQFKSNFINTKISKMKTENVWMFSTSVEIEMTQNISILFIFNTKCCKYSTDIQYKYSKRIFTSFDIVPAAPTNSLSIDVHVYHRSKSHPYERNTEKEPEMNVNGERKYF